MMAGDEISAILVQDSKLNTDGSGFVRAVAIKVATEHGLDTGEFAKLFAGPADRLFNPKATRGHVAVIAPGGPSKAINPAEKRPIKGARAGYPYCYQGSDNPDNVYERKTQVDAVFRSASLPYINYAYVDINKKG